MAVGTLKTNVMYETVGDEKRGHVSGQFST